MLTLRRLLKHELSEEVKDEIVNACNEIGTTYINNNNNNILSKYYSSTQAAIAVLTDSSLVFNVMYWNDTPIGCMGISETIIPYVSCKSYVEEFFYVVPKYRRYKCIMFLINSTVEKLRESGERALLFAGNSLGIHNVQAIYRRAGFSAVGTNLVKEI